MYKKLLPAALFFCCLSTLKAIMPNPILTSGLTAHTSSGPNTYITDGDLTNWKQCTASDIALKVGFGAEKLFITWESFGDCAWATNFTTGCAHSGTPLSNFQILTSANSTDGQDGDWTVAAQVKDNPVMSRGILIPFAGQQWFRFVADGDVGQILEIEAFDATNGTDDTWFFMGTSISQMGLKQQDTDSTTAQIIHARHPRYTPSMLRGGIGCINSTEVVEHLADYLRYAGNVKHWAIEMGTNDAWGGGDWNLDTYKHNMQTIIDSALAHGIQPVLARIIATNPEKAGWQVNQKFLDAVDELTRENNLHPGPDFYNYFLEHPELIGADGVHPNGETRGGQAMHHLWADALAPLYEVPAEIEPAPENESDSTTTAPLSHNATIPALKVNGNSIRVAGLDTGAIVEILSASGQLIEKYRPTAGGTLEVDSQVPAGFYIVVLRTATGTYSYKVRLSRVG